MDPCHAFPPEIFFSAAEGVVESLLLSLNPERSHADSGSARRRRMAAGMARTIALVTATSARCDRSNTINCPSSNDLKLQR